jgi:hypothetical protein
MCAWRISAHFSIPTSRDAGRKLGFTFLNYCGAKRAALVVKIEEWSEVERSNFVY